MGSAFFGRNDQPPAMAGMMETSSFSEIGVCRFSRNRMSSSLTKRLTKRHPRYSRRVRCVFSTHRILPKRVASKSDAVYRAKLSIYCMGFR